MKRHLINNRRGLKQQSLFYTPYHELVAEKNCLIKAYRDQPRTIAENLQALRDNIQEATEKCSRYILNEFMIDEFKGV